MQSRSQRVPVSVVVRLAVVVPLCALIAVGCGDDSRDMRAPRPDQTTAPRQPFSDAPTSSSTVEPAAAFELTTAGFVPGEAIPNRYTCRGVDQPPPLTWSNVPAGTQEMAIVMRDLTAEQVHWVVAGIDPAAGELPEGALPETVVQARNDFGTAGWTGPCPDAGSGVHTYEIRMYALAEASGLAGQPDGPPEAAAAVDRIEAAANYGEAVLVGTVAS